MTRPCSLAAEATMCWTHRRSSLACLSEHLPRQLAQLQRIDVAHSTSGIGPGIGRTMAMLQREPGFTDRSSAATSAFDLPVVSCTSSAYIMLDGTSHLTVDGLNVVAGAQQVEPALAHVTHTRRASLNECMHRPAGWTG